MCAPRADTRVRPYISNVWLSQPTDLLKLGLKLRDLSDLGR